MGKYDELVGQLRGLDEAVASQAAVSVIRAAMEAYAAEKALQPRVDKWMDACFGDAIKADTLERADRFIEEALELAQTNPAFTADRAHTLVDYVFGRPVGEPSQEVGGVMITLAAFCNAAGLDMVAAAEAELARIWTKVDQIRAKQAAKPVGAALPIAANQQGGDDAENRS